MNRLRRILFGDRPRALLYLLLPTLLSLLLDVPTRASALAGFALQGKAIYASSILISAALWALPLFLAARVWARLAEGGEGSRRARVAFRVGFALVFGALAAFCIAGQVLYHRVWGLYMGRNSLRLGVEFRSTVLDWFRTSAGALVLVALPVATVVLTIGLWRVTRRVAATRPTNTPLLLVVTFAVAVWCAWIDMIDSRFLQAALPDACMGHGMVHAARLALTGHWSDRRGLTHRTPAALPPLESKRPRRPNVVLIVAESIRADRQCSEGPPACASAALNGVVPDRVALGRLTTPAPNTFTACTVLWTGLDVTMSFAEAHSAPLLWELAHAVGYRTAYVTSQNPNYESYGVFFRNAGIDALVTAIELGGMEQEQLGAPDELAAGAALRFVRDGGRDGGRTEKDAPYFLVLHLANTHHPYRVDPALQPFSPHAETAALGVASFHNQYKNSILLEERTLEAFLTELRATPGWDDTVVVYLSDHGEQFREHGGLYHNHSLFEEELRVPGWLVAGPRALGDEERRALATFAKQRTYTQDVHATIVDLLGLEDAKASLPYADAVHGRSLIRPRPAAEPMTLLATESAVWEPTDSIYGVMYGERLLVGSPRAGFRCYDIAKDPREHTALPGAQCGPGLVRAEAAFGGPGKPAP
jgi:glucan phosphoethanolaminetransferase (alkaline phosphatase superfamily)